MPLVGCTCHLPPHPRAAQAPHTSGGGRGEGCACLGSGLEARGSHSRPVALTPRRSRAGTRGPGSMGGRAWRAAFLWRGSRAAHVEVRAPAGTMLRRRRCQAPGTPGRRGRGPGRSRLRCHNHTVSTAHGQGRSARALPPPRSSCVKAARSRSRLNSGFTVETHLWGLRPVARSAGHLLLCAQPVRPAAPTGRQVGLLGEECRGANSTGCAQGVPRGETSTSSISLVSSGFSRTRVQSLKLKPVQRTRLQDSQDTRDQDINKT